MTDVGPVEVEEVVPAQIDEGDHDRFSHVVYPKSAVMEGMISGGPRTALGGRRGGLVRAARSHVFCVQTEGGGGGGCARGAPRRGAVREAVGSVPRPEALPDLPD